MRHREGGEFPGGIGDLLDLKADHGQLAGDLVEACVRVEMILQPGQRELHRLSPPCKDGTSKARNP